jgi:hypothetical protein
MSSHAFAALQPQHRMLLEEARRTGLSKPWFDLLGELRADRLLTELDAAWDVAPDSIHRDLGVASIWASVPRMRREPAEMLRRAEWLVASFPGHSKPFSHLIFALAQTSPWPELKARIEGWRAEFSNSNDIVGPAAEVALAHEPAYTVAMLERLQEVTPHFFDVPQQQRLYGIALLRCGRRGDAAAVVASARAKWPEYPHFDIL